MGTIWQLRAYLRFPLIAVGSVVLCGCQSYEGALLSICESPERASRVPRHSLVAAETIWITQNVSNRDALRYYAGLGDLPAQDRGAALRAEARRIGVFQCPLAEKMDAWAAAEAASNRKP